MAPVATKQLVGNLAVETRMPDVDLTHDERRVWARPAGIYLDNDGRWHYWVDPNEDEYELQRDDEGWVVTCRTWSGAHTYRLGTDEQRAFHLPLAGGGRLELDDRRRYWIRPVNQEPIALVLYSD